MMANASGRRCLHWMTTDIDLPSEPGPSSETDVEVEDIWSWTSLADSLASTRPVVFTKDGWYVFILSDHIVISSQSSALDISFLS